MMTGVRRLLAGAGVAAIILLAASPTCADPVAGPTAVPSASAAAAATPNCTTPNQKPRIIRAATPQDPQMAAQQGITGDVRLLVSLDETGKPTDVKVYSSASVFLNAASIAAARNSVYLPAIRDCRAIASRYLFTVTFATRPF